MTAHDPKGKFCRMTENIIDLGAARPVSNRVPQFLIGDKVHKPEGYRFPGEIRAAFTTKAGKWRFVVEHDECQGLLHIFNAEQLRAVITPI